VNNSHRAFTIIEILIAMLILFTAIAFSNISIKAFNTYQRQSLRYQDFYITALSLKNKFSSYDKFDRLKYEGNLNLISYVVEIKIILNKRNYVVGKDGIGRNNGAFMVTLYELKMKLFKGNQEEKYKFLLTKQKKIK